MCSLKKYYLLEIIQFTRDYVLFTRNRFTVTELTFQVILKSVLVKLFNFFLMKNRILSQHVLHCIPPPRREKTRQLETSFRSSFTGQTSYLLGLSGPQPLDSYRVET
jgi:hypothetical protein